MSLRPAPSRFSGPRTRLGSFPQTGVHMPPALPYPFSVLILNQAKRRVMKFDQRAAIYFAQSVLHIGDDRVGHEQWSRDFEQRRPLDGLLVSPEVSVSVAQVAVP